MIKKKRFIILYHNIHSSKVYNTVVFRFVTKLCNHRLGGVIEPLQKAPGPSSSLPSAPLWAGCLCESRWDKVFKSPATVHLGEIRSSSAHNAPNEILFDPLKNVNILWRSSALAQQSFIPMSIGTVSAAILFLQLLSYGLASRVKMGAPAGPYGIFVPYGTDQKQVSLSRCLIFIFGNSRHFTAICQKSVIVNIQTLRYLLIRLFPFNGVSLKGMHHLCSCMWPPWLVWVPEFNSYLCWLVPVAFFIQQNSVLTLSETYNPFRFQNMRTRKGALGKDKRK